MTTFYGKGSKASVGDALSWVSIEPSQIVVGACPRWLADRVEPVGGTPVLLRDVVDVDVVAKGPRIRNALWGMRVDPFPFVLGPGPMVRIRYRSGRRSSMIFVTLDDPFAARDALLAAAAAVPPLVGDS